MPQLSHPSDRLHQAEDFLHPFALLLADRVAGMPCRPSVNRTLAGPYCFAGYEQEFVGPPILCDLSECDEFGSGRDHSLCFEQQVAEVLISAPAVDQHTDIGVDAFHHAKPYFGCGSS